MRRWARQGGALVVRPLSSSRLKPGDLAFIEEVAERMCDAVERSQYSRMLEQRVEHAIAERDRIWRLSPELLAVIDTKGRFVSVNPAVLPILGCVPLLRSFLCLAVPACGVAQRTRPRRNRFTIASRMIAPIRAAMNPMMSKPPASAAFAIT